MSSEPPTAQWPTKRQRRLGVIAFGAPLALWLVYAWTLPFQTSIAKSTVPIRALNVHQKLNIQRAASHLESIVLRPGQEFSFNRLVGPRTVARGYYDAPSYIWDGSYGTTGGGICVVSSAIYQAALSSGLKVTERVPHLRTMQTVSPGLDATVWYDGADLKFVNSTSEPVEVRCLCDGVNLTASIQGSPELSKANHFKVWRHESFGADSRVSVEVYRQDGRNAVQLISRDLYDTSAPASRKADISRRTSNLPPKAVASVSR